MKYVTPALMQEGGRKGGGWSLLRKATAQDMYYEAESCDGKTYLLWIEASRMGRNQSFPCVLRHEDALYVFESLRLQGARQKQEEMVALWEQVVTPDTIRQAYQVTRLSESEFQKRYADFRKKDVLGDAMPGEDAAPKL